MKLLLFILFSFVAIATQAQFSPFKPEPKFPAPSPFAVGNKMSYAKAAGGIGVTATDSLLNAWRFGAAISPAGFTLSGVYQAAAGLEFGLNHQDYNYASQSYTTLWSANIVWIPINTATPIKSIKSIKDIATFGALYGIPKIKLFGYNVVQVGPFYNTAGVGKFSDRAGFWVVANINL